MAKATAHPDMRLISSEDVQGTNVYGAGNEAIGEIDHLLIEKVSGRVVYAVMSFGGFLGLGHSHYPSLGQLSNTIPISAATALASRNSSCATLPSSVMTHGKIVIGKQGHTDTTGHPLTGVRDRREIRTRHYGSREH
jgi:hypothetical protein